MNTYEPAHTILELIALLSNESLDIPAYTYEQTSQSRRCLHRNSMNVNQDSDRKQIRPPAPLDMSTCPFEDVFFRVCYWYQCLISCRDKFMKEEHPDIWNEWSGMYSETTFEPRHVISNNVAF